jgi:hypothetical protein
VQKCRSPVFVTASRAPTAEVPRNATADGEAVGDGDGDGDGDGELEGDGEEVGDGDDEEDGDGEDEDEGDGEVEDDCEGVLVGAAPAAAIAVDSPAGKAAINTPTTTATEPATEIAACTHLATGGMTPRSQHRHLRFRSMHGRNFPWPGH